MVGHLQNMVEHGASVLIDLVALGTGILGRVAVVVVAEVSVEAVLAQHLPAGDAVHPVLGLGHAGPPLIFVRQLWNVGECHCYNVPSLPDGVFVEGEALHFLVHHVHVVGERVLVLVDALAEGAAVTALAAQLVLDGKVPAHVGLLLDDGAAQEADHTVRSLVNVLVDECGIGGKT